VIGGRGRARVRGSADQRAPEEGAFEALLEQLAAAERAPAGAAAGLAAQAARALRAREGPELLVAELRRWDTLAERDRAGAIAALRGFLRAAAAGPAAERAPAARAEDAAPQGGPSHSPPRGRRPASAPVAADEPAPLDRPIESLKGVGPATAERLRAKGIDTVRDVVLMLPRRYDDLREPLDASRRAEDGAHQIGHAEATVRSARSGFLRRGRRRLVARLTLDGGGEAELQLFQFGPAYAQRFQPGARLRLAGRMDARDGTWTLVHPQIVFLDGAAAPPPLVPIRPRYPDVAGLPARTLEKIVRGAADLHAGALADPLPPALLARLGLPPLGESVRAVHTPPEDLSAEEVSAVAEGRHPVARRLAFEELLSLQLALLRARARVRRTDGISFPLPSAGPAEDLAARLQSLTGLTPTAAQRRSLAEITRDMSDPAPMVRLLQGDVGAGKTLVGLGAALVALDAGYQVAMMVPTEILADQHFATLQGPLRRAGYAVGSLVGGSGRKAREALASGEVRFVVGTHALQEEAVAFERLGLVIVDEQHRFGVEQRGRLVAKGKGGRPDLLVMTATPIPRTLAMAVYGDLDVSILDERPPAWRPVPTELYLEGERDRAYEVIAADVAAGGRAYVVCPLIDESEKIDLRAATAAHAALQRRLAGRARAALLHGRQSPGEKAAALAAFASGAVQVLVSTTVVEVGIDVRQATLMVIESAERFGLSQLHQLRGRVGRPGAPRGRCLLLAGPAGAAGVARSRLEAVVRSNDGFHLAEADLRLRGPGQLLGTRQAGLADLAFADLAIHGELLAAAREVAREIVDADPTLEAPDHAALRVLADRGERLLAAG
jgi:ATP-dependent DNA helicase RecG